MVKGRVNVEDSDVTRGILFAWNASDGFHGYSQGVDEQPGQQGLEAWFLFLCNCFQEYE